jgi:predicted negative regulator of RcsB-dependent stress response
MANAIDKDQIEWLKTWWKSYGKSIAWGVLVACALVFSWKGYQMYHDRHLLAASGHYQHVMFAAREKDGDQLQREVSILQQRYSETPYAALASLMSARVSAENKQYDQAITVLSWVINESPIKSFQQMARIAQARIQIERGDYAAAKLNLDSLDDPAFKAYVEDLRGVMEAKQGHTDAARAAFSSAKQAFQEANLTDALVDMQLHSLQTP